MKCVSCEVRTELLPSIYHLEEIRFERLTSITQHTEHQHAKRRTGTAGASVKTSREENGEKRLQQHT
jgi:hypothetical protein